MEIRRKRANFGNSAIFDDICPPRARPNYHAAAGGAIFGDFRRFVWGPAIQTFVSGPGIVK